MVLGNIPTRIEEVIVREGGSYRSVQVERGQEDLLGRLSHEIFRHDCLDRRLKQHHITGT